MEEVIHHRLIFPEAGSKCGGIDKISEKFYQQYQVVLDSMVSRCLFSPSHHKKSNGLAKVHSFAGPFCFCTISNWPHHSPQVWGNPSAQRGIFEGLAQAQAATGIAYGCATAPAHEKAAQGARTLDNGKPLHLA